MPYFLIAAYVGARRALVKDQGRPEPCPLPFWQLLAKEFPLLGRRVGAVKVSMITTMFFAVMFVVEIALNEATPGPFLTPRWRLVVAILLTFVFVAGWTLIHAIRSVGFNRTPPRSSPRRYTRP